MWPGNQAQETVLRMGYALSDLIRTNYNSEVIIIKMAKIKCPVSGRTRFWKQLNRICDFQLYLL